LSPYNIEVACPAVPTDDKSHYHRRASGSPCIHRRQVWSELQSPLSRLRNRVFNADVLTKFAIIILYRITMTNIEVAP